MTWTEETRARLEERLSRGLDDAVVDVADLRAALAEIERRGSFMQTLAEGKAVAEAEIERLQCVALDMRRDPAHAECRAEIDRMRAEVERLVQMAGDWIETDPSLRSTACVEVAISHAKELERELKVQRERAEHLHEIGVRQHARAEQAEAEVERLRETKVLQAAAANEAIRLANERTEAAEARVRTLEEALLKRGLSSAPCDVCGYNGPGYYQSETHPCVARAALRGGE